MSKPDWAPAIELAEQMFGTNCCTLSTEDMMLVVKHKGAIVFLFQKKEENDYYSMHLRAGLLPNEAAWIASSFFLNMDFILGENFEIVDSNTMIYGKESLQFAADNIHKLWRLEAIKTDGKLKYDGDLAKVTRPRGTHLN